MKLICIEQKHRDKYLVDNLLKIWESSVRATHLFLSEDDIQNLIPKVIAGIKNIKKLIIITNKNNINCAFMGISENKIEMLFVGADFRGKGIGGKLINYAINTLNVLYVDVNEQNEQAIGFYEKYGFKLLGRSETDDYGNSFPILHLGKIMETIKINKIVKNKEKFMDLLLLGDEQEDMIKKYLYRGELFALYNDDLKTICVVTKEENGIYEIKNIATYEKYQGKGYGKQMIKYIIENYKNKCDKLYIGTGDNEKILSFYKSCGFTYSHTVKDFFINNYNHKIYADGKQLTDMIYLKIEYNK